MREFFRKLSWFAGRRRKEAELNEELQFHLEEETDERRAEGLAVQAARAAARRELGNLGLVQENTRAAWGWTLVEQLVQDVRYAFRTMAASPVFTALAVLSLALGIGANTAIYSFMDSILLRALPVSDPQSLAVFNWRMKWDARHTVMHGMSGSTWGDAKTGETSGMFPFPAFEMFRKNDGVFSNVFGHFQYWQARKLNLTIHGQSEIANGWNVTGSYFSGLGIPPAAGRLIAPEDDRPGAPPVAVISYGYSQRRFGGPANAAGQSILLNNLPFTVAGVTPPEFFGADPAVAPDVYLPIHMLEYLGTGRQFGFRREDYFEPHYYWIQLMGRLRPGVTLAQAQAALAPEFQRWVAATATNDEERASLPELVLKEGAGGLSTLRRRYSKPLYVLMAMVGLILALACANVANLLLARAASRRREIALRLSVGAGRWRLIRQLLTESVMLASTGGVLGILFAIWGMRFLTLLLANGRADFTLRAELNWHVLGVAAALSVLTGILFGLAPALQATRADVMPALKEARTGLREGRRAFHRVSLSQVLVVSQIAIALLMLVGAGLFVRTLNNLQSINLGFNRENVLLFQLDARKAGHQDPEISTFYGDLRNRFEEIPGVRNASLSEDSLVHAGTGLPLYLPDGKPVNHETRILNVGPAFFGTMQIPILAGRDFQANDRLGSSGVAIVNQLFVKTYFEGRNPLGQHLVVREGGRGKAERFARDLEIVGVAKDSCYGGLTRDIPPVAYMLYDQGFPRPDEMTFALRTAGDPLRYITSVREIVRQADGRVPVTDVRTQIQDIDRTINQEITFADLCTGFAILAMVIACVGLYGTVAYNVARRTGEIGIRMALGARRGVVVRMVLGEVLLLAIAGLAAGLGAAMGTSKFVSSFLYGLKANDPLAQALAVAALLAAALAAGYVPALRASRIDPMTALRNE